MHARCRVLGARAGWARLSPFAFAADSAATAAGDDACHAVRALAHGARSRVSIRTPTLVTQAMRVTSATR